jgi:hypothetical protein
MERNPAPFSAMVARTLSKSRDCLFVHNAVDLFVPLLIDRWVEGCPRTPKFVGWREGSTPRHKVVTVAGNAGGGLGERV